MVSWIRLWKPWRARRLGSVGTKASRKRYCLPVGLGFIDIDAALAQPRHQIRPGCWKFCGADLSGETPNGPSLRASFSVKEHANVRKLAHEFAAFGRSEEIRGAR